MYYQISQQNRNRIRKYLRLLSGAQMGSNHEKLEKENIMTHFLQPRLKIFK